MIITFYIMYILHNFLILGSERGFWSSWSTWATWWTSMFFSFLWVSTCLRMQTHLF